MAICTVTVSQVQVHNHASSFIQRLFDWRAGAAANMGGIDDQDGEQSDQKIDREIFRKAKCAVYIYYK